MDYSRHQEHAVKKLEMKDLTDAEKAEITLLLQKHRPMQIIN